MNRINKVFEKKKNLLSIYFTAGFPEINDTLKIIKELDKSQVDMIEIGLPFSDPLADGETIQMSSPDFGVNPYTYADTNNTAAVSQPHGVG